MKLVVGLGNPGWRYRKTRHNVGFNVVNGLAKLSRVRVRRRKHKALLGEGVLASQPTLLAKPTTFVNNSGEAVREILREYQIPLSDLLVICDDMDLPLGRLRIRRRGSSGGHKGLESICNTLQTQDFCRLRIGISRNPNEDAYNYVLSKFNPAERRVMTEAEIAAQQAVCVWLEKGVEACMAAYN